MTQPASDPVILDDNAVRVQLEAHHAASFGWALACCGRDPDLAADVLQAAYLKVLQGRAKFFGQSAFKTWWFAVIRNTAADERRRHWLRRLKHTALATLWPADDSVPPAPVEAHERQALLTRALAALPARQREVLHLVFYQQLTIEQAAPIVGVSVGTARTHYTRGKQNLRRLLESLETSHEQPKDRSRAIAPAIVL